MAMEPLQSTWINPPPTIASSAYSPGGAFYPTPQNSYNTAPVNYGYSSQFYSPYSMAPASNGNSGGGSIISPSNIGSIAKQGGQFVSNGFSLPQSSFVNNIGTGLGFAPGSVSYTAAGSLPWQTAGSIANPAMAGMEGVGSTVGSLGTSSTLSSTLGAAGIGALAGSFLGRIGGNSMGGSVGGAIGAGIGNMIAPGIGGVIGGALGGTIGGFFGGGKPKTNADTFTARLTESGATEGYENRAINAQQTAGFAQNQNNNISSIFSGAAKDLGIKFNKDIVLGGGISTKHPQAGGDSHIWLDDKQNGTTLVNQYYQGGDVEGENRAYLAALKAAAAQSGYTDSAAIDTWFANKVAQQNAPQAAAGSSGMPFIPIKDNQRFADFMGKFKEQGTPNV